MIMGSGANKAALLKLILLIFLLSLKLLVVSFYFLDASFVFVNGCDWNQKVLNQERK